MFLRVNTFVGFVLVHVGFSASRVPAEGALGLNVAPEDGDEEEERKRKRMQEEELQTVRKKSARSSQRQSIRKQTFKRYAKLWSENERFWIPKTKC